MSDLPAAHRSSDSPVAGADPEAQSDQVFELAAEVFRLMSAPMRLRIISALCQGEKNVGELLRETKVQVIEEDASGTVNAVPSKFLERFDTLAQAHAELQHLCNFGSLDAQLISVPLPQAAASA